MATNKPLKDMIAPPPQEPTRVVLAQGRQGRPHLDHNLEQKIPSLEILVWFQRPNAPCETGRPLIANVN